MIKNCIYITSTMHLREDEQILKVVHHHPTPYVFLILKMVMVFFPFFFLLFFLQSLFSAKIYLLVHLFIIFIFSLIITYFSLIYWLDKLVITNRRVVYINWNGFLSRHESEAFLSDIQDVQTHEKGFLSYFWIFDYGDFVLETSASHISVRFKNSPNPEGIRRYIYHIRQQ